MNDFITEFLAGQNACSKGKPCPVDASDAFKRGYEAEKLAKETKHASA